MPRLKHQNGNKGNGKVPKQYTFRGITGTIKELHSAFPWPMGLSALRWRLRQGMTLEEAYRTPAWDWQRKHADLSTKKLMAYKARIAAEGLPGAVKARKPNHPAEIQERYMGRCCDCGALVLKGSLSNGSCCHEGDA